MNQWVDGFGDLPDNLVRFALTLPWWQVGKLEIGDDLRVGRPTRQKNNLSL